MEGTWNRIDRTGPGQESVGDHPAPPIGTDSRRVVVEFAAEAVADTTRAIRILETSGAPTFCLPRSGIRNDLLRPARGITVCEWKGVASYLDLVVDGRVAPRAALTYPEPTPGIE